MKNKRKDSKLKSDAFFAIAIAGMLVLIYTISFVAFGTLTQKTLFFLGGALLLLAAAESRQNTLIAIETVALAGVLLSFFLLSFSVTMLAMLVVIAVMLAYFVYIGHYKKHGIEFLGTAGFILLALGYAFNSGDFTLLTSFFFAFGALVIVVYSLFMWRVYKIRLQAIWFVLNLVFMISPLLLFLSLI